MSHLRVPEFLICLLSCGLDEPLCMRLDTGHGRKEGDPILYDMRFEYGHCVHGCNEFMFFAATVITIQSLDCKSFGETSLSGTSGSA